MSAIALPAPFETPRVLIRLPRWARPWEHTLEDDVVAAVAIDQANVGEFTQDTAGSTIAITTGVNVASGGFVVLAVGWAVASSAPTLSSVGGGLTWTIDKQGAPGANGAAVAIVSAQAPSGLASGTVITATLSGSAPGARVLVASSWTGVATSSPVDVAGAIQTITSSTAWTTGNLTVLAGSLIVGFAAGLNTDGTSAPTSPSIETHDVTGGAGSYNDTAAYRIEAGAGTVAVAGTFSTAQTGAGVGVAYKAAAAATGKGIVADTRRVARNSLLRRQPVAVYMNALRPNWRPRPSGVLVPSYS